MAIESNAITLDHSVEIYVPTESRYGELLPDDLRAEVLENVKSSLYDWFGGVTKKEELRVEQVEGSWRLASGEMANERVDVVYANASREDLEEHFEDLPVLAAEVANRLAQEAVAFRVDKKMTLIPGDENKSPRGYKSPRVKDRMRALQAALQRISSVRDARDLFCNVLHYEFEDEQLATAKWPDQLKACLAPGTAPRIIADQNGFKILYLQLAEDYLRKGHERQLVQRIIKDDPTLRGLVVVSDVDQKEWHLVNAKFAKEEGKKESLRLRRMRVGSGQSVRTAVERLSMVDVETVGEDVTAAQLQDLHDEAFDVESVSKEFFNEISNWYFWALSRVEFPEDTLKDGDDEKHRATSLIRFLTRIIFCWFLKEKKLIPENLFCEKDLADILSDLDEDSCSYHQGILQNLFFATLNQRMGKDSKTGKPYRAFAKDEGFAKNRSTYGVDTLYRYEEHFQDSDKALSHFAEVPFLNGGLFECLDRTDEDSGKKLYVDGFSRNKKKRARVPNHLFFAGEQSVDLSGKSAYGDAKFKKAKVRGLLRILHAYNFTVEENTPIDEEIALDPELLGKVFENLLASYNEETKTTARKQTGSFYTPRPIVEYMVDESVKAHLCGTLTTLGRKEEEAREQLDLLLGYTDEEPSFSEKEIDALLESIHTCKILDPACGSGAFPIGMLQKLVHVVHKLDPENVRWKQLQIDQAAKIPDSSARNAAIKAIEHDFEENGDDYGRKLYLIENCLYGVDIQPIAIHISKLRFFISLICDQKISRNKAKNHGIRALPNLETKFVAANTLLGLPEMDQMALVDPRVNKIESQIESLYHRHFSVQRRDQKLGIQRKLKELRTELGLVLAESLGSSQKAQHLADWDPFDSQASADFFDPHWMFGRLLTEGFHIVLGNPPYLKERDNKPIFDKITRTAWGKAHHVGKMDYWFFFLHRAFDIVRKNGVVAFITSRYWMNSAGARHLIQTIQKEANLFHVVDIGSLPVFEAVAGHHMVHFYRRSAKQSICMVKSIEQSVDDIASNESSELLKITEQSQSDLFRGNEIRLYSMSVEIPSGATLGDHFEVSQGVVQNPDKVSKVMAERYNLPKGAGVFVLEPHEFNKLTLSPAEMGFVKHFFEDSALKRFQLVTDNYKFLLYVTKKNCSGVSEIPAIAAHLQKFREIMEARRETLKGSIAWFQMHWPRDPVFFEDPKVAIPSMFSTPQAAYVHDPAYFGIGANVIIQGSGKFPLRVLTGIINSSIGCWWFLANGKKRGTGVDVGVSRLREFPLPLTSGENLASLSCLVSLLEQCLERDGSASEKEQALFLDEVIDACVMECYFRDHMEERDLLFLEDLAPLLGDYDPEATEEEQLAFLEHFQSTHQAKGSKIRDRLDRICTDSPDLLAVIKKEGKV